jgi:hypothetical protein
MQKNLWLIKSNLFKANSTNVSDGIIGFGAFHGIKVNIMATSNRYAQNTTDQAIFRFFVGNAADHRPGFGIHPNLNHAISTRIIFEHKLRDTGQVYTFQEKICIVAATRLNVSINILR